MHKPDSIYSETISHLREVGPGRYELIEPHLLYLNTKQAHQYLTQVMSNDNYRDEGFHDDLVSIVKDYAQNLCKPTRNNQGRFELVDMGPGYPDKTLPILREAFRAGMKEICYMPVDVSDKYLAVAGNAVRDQIPGAIISPEKSKFEELTAARFCKRGLHEPTIFLGLTYMNFPSDKIGALLRDLSTHDSTVMVASELLTEHNTRERVTQRYMDREIVQFTFNPLVNLGYSLHDFKSEVRFNEEESRVEVVFTYVKPSPVDIIGGVLKVGDQVTTFASYRYEKDDLDRRLERYFSEREIFMAPSGNTALAICRL